MTPSKCPRTVLCRLSASRLFSGSTWASFPPHPGWGLWPMLTLAASQRKRPAEPFLVDSAWWCGWRVGRVGHGGGYGAAWWHGQVAGDGGAGLGVGQSVGWFVGGVWLAGGNLNRDRHGGLGRPAGTGCHRGVDRWACPAGWHRLGGSRGGVGGGVRRGVATDGWDGARGQRARLRCGLIGKAVGRTVAKAVGPKAAQPERVGDDKDTGAGHRRARDQRVEQAERGQRERSEVVAERPEQVPLDDAQGLP